jgi:hypothetical protein
MRLKLTVAGLALLAWLGCAVAPASGGSGRLVDLEGGFTSSSPATPTGMSTHLFFRRAGDPNAKPPPLDSAVIRLPRGLRFDTTAVPQCMASDEEIHALGANACPDETRLTIGSFSAIGGFGPPADPFEGDDHVFNGPSQLVEVITFKGSSASPVFDRVTIRGSTLTAHPPAAPGGPPEGRSSVRSIDFAIPVREAGGKSLITTPPDCPASRRWTTVGTFGFADGSMDTVSSQTPCRPPHLRLAIRPRRVRAGRSQRVRLRVTSTARRCQSGVRIRLGDRRVRTDRRGRARLSVRFGRGGVRRVRATHPRCRPAIALIRVVARPQPEG